MTRVMPDTRRTAAGPPSRHDRPRCRLRRRRDPTSRLRSCPSSTPVVPVPDRHDPGGRRAGNLVVCPGGHEPHRCGPGGHAARSIVPAGHKANYARQGRIAARASARGRQRPRGTREGADAKALGGRDAYRAGDSDCVAGDEGFSGGAGGTGRVGLHGDLGGPRGTWGEVPNRGPGGGPGGGTARGMAVGRVKAARPAGNRGPRETGGGGAPRCGGKGFPRPVTGARAGKLVLPTPA